MKRVAGRGINHGQVAFPHQFRCGLIEASGVMFAHVFAFGFPHQFRCGLIEAVDGRRRRFGRSSFPHQFRCGLIEA